MCGVKNQTLAARIVMEVIPLLFVEVLGVNVLWMPRRLPKTVFSVISSGVAECGVETGGHRFTAKLNQLSAREFAEIRQRLF